MSQEWLKARQTKYVAYAATYIIIVTAVLVVAAGELHVVQDHPHVGGEQLGQGGQAREEVRLVDRTQQFGGHTGQFFSSLLSNPACSRRW